MISLKQAFLSSGIDNDAISIVEGALKEGYYIWCFTADKGMILCGINTSTKLFFVEKHPRLFDGRCNEKPKKFESNNARLVAFEYFLGGDSAKDIIKSVSYSINNSSSR